MFLLFPSFSYVFLFTFPFLHFVTNIFIFSRPSSIPASNLVRHPRLFSFILFVSLSNHSTFPSFVSIHSRFSHGNPSDQPINFAPCLLFISALFLCFSVLLCYFLPLCFGSFISFSYDPQILSSLFCLLNSASSPPLLFPPLLFVSFSFILFAPLQLLPYQLYSFSSLNFLRRPYLVHSIFSFPHISIHFLCYSSDLSHSVQLHLGHPCDCGPVGARVAWTLGPIRRTAEI